MNILARRMKNDDRIFELVEKQRELLGYTEVYLHK